MSGFTWSRGFTPGLHLGVDLAASTGTPIHAPLSGRVLYAGDTRQDPSPPSWSYWQGRRGAAGIAALVDVGGGRLELYAHMSQLRTSRGSSLRAGDVVGLVGATGYAFGSHLHFAEISGGHFVDPMSLWTRPQLIAAVSSGSAVPASSSGPVISRGQIDAWYSCIGAGPLDTITAELAGRMAGCATSNGIDLGALKLDPSTYVGRPVREFVTAMAKSTGQYVGAEDVVPAILGGLAGALSPLLWLAAILTLILLGLYVTLSGGGSSS